MPETQNILISDNQSLSILNLIPTPVYYVDANHIYQYANPEYERWMGQPMGSIVGKSMEEVLPGNAYLKIRNRVNAALNGQNVEYKTRVDLPYKNNIAVRAVYTPQTGNDGTVIGYLGMLYDITGERRAESALDEMSKEIQDLNNALEQKVQERTHDLEMRNAQLKESEERYHRMVEEVEDYAIILMDKDGYILNWNRGAEKIKGYSEQEILGRNFRLFYLPEDQANGLPDRLITEATVKGRAAHEGWRVTKSGSRFWGSIVITALHNAQGDVTGFTKLTRNLTERKLAEDKLRQNAEILERQNKELEQFAYIASHDMKEPLRKIMLYSNMLAERISGQVGERENLYLERTQHAATRMQRLIEDLLAYSRTSFHAESTESLNLNQLVAETVEFYREAIDEANGTVSAAVLPTIKGIGFQVRQLFDNLISNAVKYRKPEIPLAINVTYQKVTCESIAGLSLMVPDDKTTAFYHRVSIHDNGIGFSPEYAQKVFELFQRLAAKDDQSGSGIGLSICKKIMQNHNGYIEATGNENEGAAFALYFPAADK